MATFNDVKIGQAFRCRNLSNCYGVKINPVIFTEDWTCIGEGCCKTIYNIIYITDSGYTMGYESSNTEVEPVDEIKFVHTY